MVSRILNVIAGAWLALGSLVITEPGAPARTNDLATGAALVLVVLLAAPGTGPGFAAVLLGVWLMVAPAVLAYPSVGSVANDIIAGLAVVALALHPAFGVARAERALARLRTRNAQRRLGPAQP